MSNSLPTRAFSDAKANLSSLMDEVVHAHLPHLVHRRREQMMMIGVNELLTALASFRFECDVASSKGEVTVHVRELDVLGLGATFDEALDDAVSQLRAYAGRYFERAAFYAQTDRARHAPWLLRFAVTPENQQRELLTEPPPDMAGGGEPTAAQHRREAALA